MDVLKDPAKRAELVYGQPMAPCPACGSYDMKPQMPIAMETTGDETVPQLVGKWARATKAGATPLEGPCYYMCWDCGHKAPAVDCSGRTSEDCRQDRALNAEMKRLWNEQTPHRAVDIAAECVITAGIDVTQDRLSVTISEWSNGGHETAERWLPNCCEACAMDLATCDCVNARPVWVRREPPNVAA